MNSVVRRVADTCIIARFRDTIKMLFWMDRSIAGEATFMWETGMPEPWLWILIACLTVAVVAFFMWRPFRAAAREAHFAHACKEFHKQREWLEVKFISLAGAPSKPDAPRWSNCEFDDAVHYVRHRGTGELSAFVALTVAFEGIGPKTASMTDLMSNLQAGTAVFRFNKAHWVTDGRVILNLSPAEAIRFYHNDLEVVGQEMADGTV